MATTQDIERSEDIYEVLEADPAFMAMLGTLQFQEGPQVGLLVAVADNPLLDTVSASGLIVIIEKFAETRSKRFVTPSALINKIFTMRVIEFPGTTQDLRDAVEHILLKFPGAIAIPLGAPDQIGSTGQSVIKLPQYPVAVL